MTQTFDIRFARSAGLAAMLEVPENAFRWKGGGLLHIDAQGISIGLKRGLLALLGGKRTQRIPTEDLRAVYREGDALRVEFQSGQSTRIVLPFWADDRDTAARIVQLLPTSQTVEMEHSPAKPKPRADWGVLLSLAIALVALAAGSWALYQRAMPSVASTPALPDGRAASEVPAPVPVSDSTGLQVQAPKQLASSAPWSEAPAIPLTASRQASSSAAVPSRVESVERPVSAPDASNAMAAPDSAPGTTTATNRERSPQTWLVRVSSDGIVPFTPGMPVYEIARRQLDLFGAESNTLRGYFEEARYAGSNQRFREISILWEKVSIRVGNSPDFEDPVLRPLQEIELAVSRAWRRALKMLEDPALLVSADEEVEFAEMLEARARQFVD